MTTTSRILGVPALDLSAEALRAAGVPWFDVTHPRFGPKRTRVQTAIWAAAGVGVAFIPASDQDYEVEDVLYVPSHSIIVGQGRRSRLVRAVGSLAAGQPGNIFRNVNYSDAVAGVDRNIVLCGLTLSMQSERGNVRPLSSRDYATVLLGGVDGLSVSDLWFEESLHFTLSMSRCDNAHARRIDIRAQYASTPVGNVDGVHFTNCQEFSLVDAVIHSGDDMVGVTTDAGGRESFNGVVRNVRGSSAEANGVIFNTESGGGFDLTDMLVSGIRFTSRAPVPSGSAVKFKGDSIAKPNQYAVIAGRSVVSDVRAVRCGSAVELNYAQDVDVGNIQAFQTSSHGLHLNAARSVNLGNIHTRESGGAWAVNRCGVNIGGGERITIDGAKHESDTGWGIQINSATDVTLDNVLAYGCGTNAGAVNTAGMRVINATRVVVGAGCGSRANGVSKYGLALEANNTDVSCDARLGMWEGTTAPYFNNGGSRLRANDGVSADRGDGSVTLVAGVDETEQRFATALTANRTVTLSNTNIHKGARFRVVRTGLGAFTLDVGGLKTIPISTPAFVDVEHDGAAWRLIGYGVL